MLFSDGNGDGGGSSGEPSPISWQICKVGKTLFYFCSLKEFYYMFKLLSLSLYLDMKFFFFFIDSILYIYFINIFAWVIVESLHKNIETVYT